MTFFMIAQLMGRRIYAYNIKPSKIRKGFIALVNGLGLRINSFSNST